MWSSNSWWYLKWILIQIFSKARQVWPVTSSGGSSPGASHHLFSNLYVVQACDGWLLSSQAYNSPANQLLLHTFYIRTEFFIHHHGALPGIFNFNGSDLSCEQGRIWGRNIKIIESQPNKWKDTSALGTSRSLIKTPLASNHQSYL